MVDGCLMRHGEELEADDNGAAVLKQFFRLERIKDIQLSLSNETVQY